MKKLFILPFLVAGIIAAKAQNADCKVSADPLKGTYEGACKNGKAEGKGKASGVDSYDGEFRNGLPDGNGKYTWKNGDFYDGEWKKGLRDGKGEMKMTENNVASVKTGYWKKDKYMGLYENPYKIVSTTSDMGRVEVRNMSRKGSSITVTVKTLVANTGGYGSDAALTDFQVTRGSYTTKSNTRLTNSDVTTFRNIVFPFVANFYFGSSILQIEIYEEGEWDIYVPINGR